MGRLIAFNVGTKERLGGFFLSACRLSARGIVAIVTRPTAPHLAITQVLQKTCVTVLKREKTRARVKPSVINDGEGTRLFFFPSSYRALGKSVLTTVLRRRSWGTSLQSTPFATGKKEPLLYSV